MHFVQGIEYPNDIDFDFLVVKFFFGFRKTYN
jgi:hypothetical protein